MYAAFPLTLPNKNSESQPNTLVSKQYIDRKEAEENLVKPPGASRPLWPQGIESIEEYKAKLRGHKSMACMAYMKFLP